MPSASDQAEGRRLGAFLISPCRGLRVATATAAAAITAAAAAITAATVAHSVLATALTAAALAAFTLAATLTTSGLDAHTPAVALVTTTAALAAVTIAAVSDPSLPSPSPPPSSIPAPLLPSVPTPYRHHQPRPRQCSLRPAAVAASETLCRGRACALGARVSMHHPGAAAAIAAAPAVAAATTVTATTAALAAVTRAATLAISALRAPKLVADGCHQHVTVVGAARVVGGTRGVYLALGTMAVLLLAAPWLLRRSRHRSRAAPVCRTRRRSRRGQVGATQLTWRR